MENKKIEEAFKQMSEMFKKAKAACKAFVFMPDLEMFRVYEVSEKAAKLALIAEGNIRKNNDFVIEVFNREQGKKVKEYFEKEYSLDLHLWEFNNNYISGDRRLFYGFINGVFSVYNTPELLGTPIKTLDELTN